MNEKRHLGIYPLDHTGDVGFDLEAESLNELFEAAMIALLRAIFTLPPEQVVWNLDIQLEATTLETLFVQWLDELLFLTQTRNSVPVRCTPEVHPQPGGWRLSASLGTAPLEPEKQGWQGELKATTYHDLTIGKREGAWHARIIFDV
ncbi:MAG: archease [Trueperaceae bacterium]|nr:MAG: archease [Trueperaceae bacterium]